MYYEVYIDAVFIVNVFLNLLSLQALDKVLQCTATHWRLLLGAIVGGGCQCLLIIIGIGPVWIKFLLGSFGVGMLMVHIGLRMKQLHFLLRDTMVMLLINILLVGSVECIRHEIQCFFPHMEHIVEVIGIFYVMGWILLGALHKARDGKQMPLYQIIITENGKELVLQALLDTGNGLRDPIYGRPVSIVEGNVVAAMEPLESQPGFCMIPYHSLGKKEGMLPGFLLRNVCIIGSLKEKKVDEMLVGVYQGKLSSGNQYQMILHPKLMD